jgi:hypothetical protein
MGLRLPPSPRKWAELLLQLHRTGHQTYIMHSSSHSR